MEDHSFSSDDEDNNNNFNDYGLDIDIPPSSSTKVFTKEDITAARREDLGKVIDALSLSEHQARTLLTHARWNMEKLFDEIVDKGIDQVKSEAGVTEISEDYDIVSSAELATIKCCICITKVSTDVVTEMDCGHFFCNNCWTEYFITKIEEGQSKGIRGIICMALDCNTLCDEAKIKHLLGSRDPELAAKFETLLLESYMEKNKNVKWCPKHCGNAICLESDRFSDEVECPCGQQFCFSCLNEGHTPCSCLMWKLWAKKFEDESGNINWIIENTNPCPQCHMPVEKDGGYNYISCICGQVFCWACGYIPDIVMEEDWGESLSGHYCLKREGYNYMEAQLVKKEPWRYMHYYKRYKAYTDLLEIESMLSQTIQENVSKLQRRLFSKDLDGDELKRSFPEDLDANIFRYIQNCSWITESLFKLFRSRRFMAFTYVFAYYTFGDQCLTDELNEEKWESKQQLFEYQHKFLEENVERLSMLIESPFHWYSEDQIMQLRLDVITLSNIVDDLYKKLYECINDDGFDSTQQSDHNIASEQSEKWERTMGSVRLDIKEKQQ